MALLKITSIVPAKFQKGYFHLAIEGQKPIKLQQQLLAEHPELKENASLGENQLAEILEQAERQRALEYGYALLSYSPRSQKALTEKLQRKSFSSDAVHWAIAHLKQKNLLDDGALARAVVENKLKSSRPLGERRLAQDLQRQGVDSQTVQSALAQVKAENDGAIPDEDERAWIALLQRSRQIKNSDARALQRRLFDYLTRRGFSFDSANKALSRFKREQKIPDDEFGQAGEFGDTP